MTTPSNASEKNKQIAEARRDFYLSLSRTFDTPDGKRTLEWLHAAAATRKPAFIPGDRDPYAAAARDGRKSLVWEIEANLEEARQSYGAKPDTGKPSTSGRRSTRGKVG